VNFKVVGGITIYLQSIILGLMEEIHIKTSDTDCPALFANKYYSEILQILAQRLENKTQSESFQKFEPGSSQMQVKSYRASAKFLPTTPHFVCTDRV